MLGNDGTLVVQPRMAGPAQRYPRVTQKVARSITPSREPHPQGIQRKICKYEDLLIHSNGRMCIPSNHLLVSSQEATYPRQDIGPLGAYALSKKGKAIADITYSSDDPPKAYTNSTIHSRISSYCDSAHAIHGPDFNPYTEAISGDAAMRTGGGKQHRRY